MPVVATELEAYLDTGSEIIPLEGDAAVLIVSSVAEAIPGISDDSTIGEVFTAWFIDYATQQGGELKIKATLEDGTEKFVTFDECTTDPGKNTVVSTLEGYVENEVNTCELQYGGQSVTFYIKKQYGDSTK